MANTTSIAWPNLFDVSRNRVNVVEDNVSIVNRTKLLILTEPTELYNSPTFGVGLKRYLWQYNTANTRSIIQDRIRDQLRLFEPCVDPDGTQFSDGLLFTGDINDEISADNYNRLQMTIGLATKYGDVLDVELHPDDLQAVIDKSQSYYSSLTTK